MARAPLQADSFRLLDLPLELQRKILEQYFGTPWTIRSIKRCKYRQEEKYRFNFNLNIMLASRHLYRETVAAMLKTRAGTYDCPNEHSLTQFDEAKPTYFDSAIHKFDSCGAITSYGFDRLHDRFRNLKIVHLIGERGDENFVDALLWGEQVSLVEILERKHDQDICNRVISIAKQYAWYAALKHLTIQWTQSDYLRHQSVPPRSRVGIEQLIYTVELSQAKCTLSKMKYRKIEDVFERESTERYLELQDVIDELRDSKLVRNT